MDTHSTHILLLDAHRDWPLFTTAPQKRFLQFSEVEQYYWGNRVMSYNNILLSNMKTKARPPQNYPFIQCTNAISIRNKADMHKIWTLELCYTWVYPYRDSGTPSLLHPLEERTHHLFYTLYKQYQNITGMLPFCLCTCQFVLHFPTIVYQSWQQIKPCCLVTLHLEASCWETNMKKTPPPLISVTIY